MTPIIAGALCFAAGVVACLTVLAALCLIPTPPDDTHERLEAANAQYRLGFTAGEARAYESAARDYDDAIGVLAGKRDVLTNAVAELRSRYNGKPVPI